MKKNCVICGNEFEVSIRLLKTKKTCSQNCAKKKNRLYARIRRAVEDRDCIICGVKFRPRSSQITCGSECRKKRIRWRYKKQNNERRKDQTYVKKLNERSRLRFSVWYKNPENKLKYQMAKREWLRKDTKKHPTTNTRKFFLSLKLGQSVQQTNTMKTTTQTTVIQVPTAQEIVQAFDRLMKETKAVCGLLAIACDANERIFDEIIALDSRFNYNMLESMRKVGKSELYEELLFDPSHNARRLLTFPPKQQQEIYTKPIKIVKQVGGKNVVEEKAFQKLSKHECALVLDESKKRVRTVEEQIGFIKTPAPLRAERYEIHGDKLVVLAKTEFSMTALEDILSRMKSKEIQKLVTK